MAPSAAGGLPRRPSIAQIASSSHNSSQPLCPSKAPAVWSVPAAAKKCTAFELRSWDGLAGCHRQTAGPGKVPAACHGLPVRWEGAHRRLDEGNPSLFVAVFKVWTTG